MTVSPRSSPRERLEARLEALRKDEDLVKELEDRVVGYGKQAREEHEGYAGDKSEAESSGDEHEIRASMRSILPKLASVAMPSPRSSAYSVEELIARGGTPMEAPNDDDWL